MKCRIRNRILELTLRGKKGVKGEKSTGITLLGQSMGSRSDHEEEGQGRLRFFASYFCITQSVTLGMRKIKRKVIQRLLGERERGGSGSPRGFLDW